MAQWDRNKFLYETKSLTTVKRKEMINDFIAKAQALCEQELILDDLYNSMDYKTMGPLDRNQYKKVANALNGLKIYWT